MQVNPINLRSDHRSTLRSRCFLLIEVCCINQVSCLILISKFPLLLVMPLYNRLFKSLCVFLGFSSILDVHIAVVLYFFFSFCLVTALCLMMGSEMDSARKSKTMIGNKLEDIQLSSLSSSESTTPQHSTAATLCYR